MKRRSSAKLVIPAAAGDLFEVAVPTDGRTLTPELERLGELALEKVRAVRSDNTQRAYASDWKSFERFCTQHNLSVLPTTSSTIALYLASLVDAGRRPATIARHLSSIRARLAAEQLDEPAFHPRLADLLVGVHRQNTQPVQQKAPATHDLIALMLTHCAGDSLRERRDRALLLLGAWSAMRRSELAGLQVEHLQFLPDGLRIEIRGSKTDRRNQGQVIGIGHAECPALVPALRAWLQAAGISDGWIFRRIRKNGKLGEEALSDRSVAEIVKTYADKVGMDPEDFAGHSLRAGYVTSAARSGKGVWQTMRRTRHKDINVVLRYYRERDLFSESNE